MLAAVINMLLRDLKRVLEQAPAGKQHLCNINTEHSMTAESLLLEFPGQILDKREASPLLNG